MAQHERAGVAVFGSLYQGAIYHFEPQPGSFLRPLPPFPGIDLEVGLMVASRLEGPVATQFSAFQVPQPGAPLAVPNFLVGRVPPTGGASWRLPAIRFLSFFDILDLFSSV